MLLLAILRPLRHCPVLRLVWLRIRQELIRAAEAAELPVNGSVSIGAETTIEDAHIASNEGAPVVVGKDCMLAFGVDIRSSDSHAITEQGSEKRLNPAAPIYVGDHVWVGAHVSLLKGAQVGDGSILGVRSVVTGSVPSNATAVGMPARVIREGVVWSRELA